MASVPVVDLADERASSKLLDGATGSGFVFVKSDSITVDEIKDMFSLGKSFFASSASEKEKCSINSSESGKNRGWTKMHGEILDPANQKKGDFKEAFNFSSKDPPQPLSGPLEPARTTLVDFQARCHTLCQQILHQFAVALDISPRHWFEERHDMTRGPTGSILRLLYYPSLKRLKREMRKENGIAENKKDDWLDFEEDVDVRAGAHSDYGSITLLFQQRGQPGLEILTREGKWESVPVDPLGNTAEGDALPILVNVGDLLSYWTNGLLKSTVHRVIFPKLQTTADLERDRYSMAYFCHPLDDAQLLPVPSALVRDRSQDEQAMREMEKIKQLSGRDVLTAQEHLEARLGATYEIAQVKG